MTALIIALLINLGLLTSNASWDNLTIQEQQDLTEIVIDDVTPEWFLKIKTTTMKKNQTKANIVLKQKLFKVNRSISSSFFQQF